MTELPILFVTDPTAEVARVSLALQARGYIVVDIPLAMLLSRVSAQRPALALIDADAEGAVEVVRQLRELPGGSSIEVLFVGERGKTFSDTTEAVLAGATGFLARPLDLPKVLRKIQALVPLEPLPLEAPAISSPPLTLRRTSQPPSPLSGFHRSAAPAWDSSAWSPSEAIVVPRISEELQGILRRAEARVGEVAPLVSPPPSPEEEVDAVLPPTLLDALDEPLGSSDELGSWGPSTPDNSTHHLAPEQEPPSLPIGSSPSFGPPSSLPSASPEPFSEVSTRVERAHRPPSELLAHPSFVPGAVAGERLRTSPPLSSSTPLPPTPLLRSSQVSASRSSGVPITPAPVPPPQVASPPAVVPAPPVAPVVPELPAPVVLGERDTLRLLARAIRDRFSGVLCFDGQGGLRRVVLRDGDLVTASSTVEGESLVAFLVQRGDLSGDLGAKLEGRLPPFGRHAGAALVAHGHLSQDRLWEALRGHGEWLVGRILQMEEGVCQYEAEATGRLRSEPSVFGGSTGSEVLVEIGRRVIPTEEAVQALGGYKARLGEGKRYALLEECALEPGELSAVERCRGFTVGEVLDIRPAPGFASVLLVLEALGVLEVLAPVEGESLPPPPRDELDDEALRARVKARLALVEEGDYFALLGVPRGATPYEIRRAYLDLRRSFEPSRVLSPATADLKDAIRTILEVLDEAFEILRDAVRRERYRRAIEAQPPEE
ncbi:MAG: hypothetical protein RMJ98_09950 [Myxococcales bacterium]|nr:hypothetical protein [Polyangiaceae bacterium]MDW8249611.1 hypothetical protein [Myxococcales bacterium]